MSTRFLSHIPLNKKGTKSSVTSGRSRGDGLVRSAFGGTALDLGAQLGSGRLPSIALKSFWKLAFG